MLVVSNFQNCYFSSLPHLQQDLAVSGSHIRVADLMHLFNGLFVAYWPWLGQFPPSRILSRGNDRCFAASFLAVAASISVMSVWIALTDSLCLRSARRGSHRQ